MEPDLCGRVRRPVLAAIVTMPGSNVADGYRAINNLSHCRLIDQRFRSGKAAVAFDMTGRNKNTDIA
jgi:hypothetical protein